MTPTLSDHLAGDAVRGARPARSPDRRRPLVPRQTRCRPSRLRGRPSAGRDLPRPRHGPRRAERPRTPSPARPAATSGRVSKPPGSALGRRSSPTTTPPASIAARLWWMLDDLGHERVVDPRRRDRGVARRRLSGHDRPVTRRSPRHTSSSTTPGATSSTATDVAAGLGIDGPAGRPCDAHGTAARSNRSTESPATSRPRRAHRRAETSGRTGACSTRRPSPRDSATSGRDRTDVPVVTSCGSGVTACFNSLAMRVAGLPDPILYPGSYSDWTRSGLDVAIGAEPGEPPEPA